MKYECDYLIVEINGNTKNVQVKVLNMFKDKVGRIPCHKYKKECEECIIHKW